MASPGAFFELWREPWEKRHPSQVITGKTRARAMVSGPVGAWRANRNKWLTGPRFCCDADPKVTHCHHLQKASKSQLNSSIFCSFTSIWLTWMVKVQAVGVELSASGQWLMHLIMVGWMNLLGSEWSNQCKTSFGSNRHQDHQVLMLLLLNWYTFI